MILRKILTLTVFVLSAFDHGTWAKERGKFGLFKALKNQRNLNFLPTLESLSSNSFYGPSDSTEIFAKPPIDAAAVEETPAPTAELTAEQTNDQTIDSTLEMTPIPTIESTQELTSALDADFEQQPTSAPTIAPSVQPTVSFTAMPVIFTDSPSSTTFQPTIVGTLSPTTMPVVMFSSDPTVSMTEAPTAAPTMEVITMAPTNSPQEFYSLSPTMAPTVAIIQTIEPTSAVEKIRYLLQMETEFVGQNESEFTATHQKVFLEQVNLITKGTAVSSIESFPARRYLRYSNSNRQLQQNVVVAYEVEVLTINYNEAIDKAYLLQDSSNNGSLLESLNSDQNLEFTATKLVTTTNDVSLAPTEASPEKSSKSKFLDLNYSLIAGFVALGVGVLLLILFVWSRIDKKKPKGKRPVLNSMEQHRSLSRNLEQPPTLVKNNGPQMEMHKPEMKYIAQRNQMQDISSLERPMVKEQVKKATVFVGGEKEDRTVQTYTVLKTKSTPEDSGNSQSQDGGSKQLKKTNSGSCFFPLENSPTPPTSQPEAPPLKTIQTKEPEYRANPPKAIEPEYRANAPKAIEPEYVAPSNEFMTAILLENMNYQSNEKPKETPSLIHSEYMSTTLTKNSTQVNYQMTTYFEKNKNQAEPAYKGPPKQKVIDLGVKAGAGDPHYNPKPQNWPSANAMGTVRAIEHNGPSAYGPRVYDNSATKLNESVRKVCGLTNRISALFKTNAHANQNSRIIAVWAEQITMVLNAAAARVLVEPHKAQLIHIPSLDEAFESLEDLFDNARINKLTNGSVAQFALSIRAKQLVDAVGLNLGAAFNKSNLVELKDLKLFLPPPLQVIGLIGLGPA
mmetsp:Transcript_7651/g.11496  ORF Transcript_7651/g.11496 Transcript_7651/m.11496 type:complete len:845 (-) Transcript_7651:249-2783(-)|eukprot:CAMPEP_0171462556 /NCGR_PEP_ID=MMETSP0945-20130129/6546_1 /TAXON_ID=109269 /ORGANISM="Vaucheria litorea, Strain CCMP2940" /LENGTH=844 /DNA_ID=CAMNT_0011989105 /DNA_START=139 /DNA_END=2673 /DNA_ORIENTATION=-